MIQERIYATEARDLPQHSSCTQGILQGDYSKSGENSRGNWYCRHVLADGSGSWYHYVNKVSPNNKAVQSMYYRNLDGSSSYRNFEKDYGWYQEAPTADFEEQSVKLEDTGATVADYQSDEESIKTELQDLKLED